ncbi:hypothetical protein K438DRAFT_1969352 [Mycena galopus ATCC 62051]|nr:hypothetical protein K438DRAFT_1969352 [Mycena galopus ATCC 62051]
MVPYLAQSVHVARTIQIDTTFARTLFSPLAGFTQTALIALIISVFFDEVQKVIFRLTGKHLRFKRFTPNGNLLTLAAQVQGASDSFLPTNVPEYSAITITDPDEFSLYCVRAAPRT